MKCTQQFGFKFLLRTVNALAFSVGLAAPASASELDCSSACSLGSYAGALWSASSTQSSTNLVINSFVAMSGSTVNQNYPAALLSSNNSQALGTLGAGNEWPGRDYPLNSGISSSDLFANIPVGATGTNTATYIYLFSQFGATSGYASNGGVAPWAVKICDETGGMQTDGIVPVCSPPQSAVPEPGSLILIGSGIAGLLVLARKRKS